MKESEARRAEREARADIATHGKATTRHEGAMARYLAAMGYGKAEPPEPPEAAEEPEPKQVEPSP